MQSTSDEQCPLITVQTLETPEEYKQRWRSIRVVYFVVFLAGLGFSIRLPSLWPYLKQVDKESNDAFLGWAVASFSVGRLFASPVLGFWANKRPKKEPFYVTLVLIIVGNVLYIYAEAFEHNARLVVLSARVITGVGSGNAAVVQAFLVEATTFEERTRALSLYSACQSLGVVLGPVIQMIFVPIGETGLIWQAIRLHLNMYTVPALLCALLASLSLLLIVLVLKQPRKVFDDDDKPETDNKSNEHSAENSRRLPYDRLAVATCVLTNFVAFTIISLIETILTPLTMSEYGWTRSSAVLYTGIFLAGLCMFSLCGFFSVAVLSKRMDERLILIVSFIVMLISNFLLLPWGDKYPPLQDVNSTLPGAGCPVQFEWCHTVPQLNLEQLITALCLVGYGMALASVFTPILSKIMGPHPQGTMMGILAASSSLARTVGPIAVTALYSNYGPRMLAVFIISLLLVNLACVLQMYKRLVPYKASKEPTNSTRRSYQAP